MLISKTVQSVHVTARKKGYLESAFQQLHRSEQKRYRHSRAHRGEGHLSERHLVWIYMKEKREARTLDTHHSFEKAIRHEGERVLRNTPHERELDALQ